MPHAFHDPDPVIAADSVRAYGRWLRDVSRDGSFDPYYSEETARFELRDGDVLATPGDVQVEPSDCGVLLVSERARARLPVCGVSPGEASAALAAIDGSLTASEVVKKSRVAASAWTALVARAFGVVVFAPLAVARLQARVASAEIVRFPGSPYEIVRSYWENMSDVAARTGSLEPALESTRGFVRFLRELHVAALVGASERSFYRPASAIVGKGDVEPGALLHTPSVVEEAPGGTRFVSGPRVGAARIGGEIYQALLARSLSDPGALDDARSMTDAEGRPWGRVVVARAATDQTAAPWFMPPRPLTEGHFDALRLQLTRALQAWRRGHRHDLLLSLAQFHWGFVRLHPFPAANQCVAMSLVNHVLHLAGPAGVPHLVLDHLALRFSGDAYAVAFRRGVDAWLVTDESPVQRTLELVSRKRQAFALLEQIGTAASTEEASRSMVEQVTAARCLLL
jgi:hypothetical protein